MQKKLLLIFIMMATWIVVSCTTNITNKDGCYGFWEDNKWGMKRGTIVGKNADYKQDLIVDQYSKSGKIIQTYKFLGAFPTALSSIELGWENPVMQTYTCTWTYDCWEHGGSLSTDPRNLQFALDG